MKKIVLYFLSFCFFYNNALAQTAVSGQITSAKPGGIAHASVHVLNTNEGVIADANGNYSLTILPGSYTIEYSAVGYATKSFKVDINNKSLRLDIRLLPAENSLDAVLVTAQKKEEMLQRLPVSITALNERQVEQYRLWNSKDLTAIVPNLYAADPGDKRVVTGIRGIASTSYDPAVATYIDGVNQFGLDTYIASLFDVQRIEVLRGPQGTLYGRNAMGGVINIITKAPGNKTTGFAEVSAGNYGAQRYSAGIQLPLVKDKLFFGAAALYDGFNGYYTNEFNNSKYDKQHSITGNYFLKYRAGRNWAATLNVKNNNNRNGGPFPLVFGAADAFAKPYVLSQNALTHIIDNTLNTSLSLNYTGRGFNFNAQTAYQSNYRYYSQPIDADFAPIDGITIINNYGKQWNNVKVLTQELKFTSPAGSTAPLQWTAGAYLFYQNSPNKQATHFGNDAQYVGVQDTNFSLINTTKAKSSGAAIYGQATYSFANKFDVTGGLRYDYEHKQQNIVGEYAKDPDPTPLFAYRTDTSATTNFNALQPKLSIAYHANDKHLLFVTYSKGYRPGGLTPLSSDPSQPALYAFKPEYSNNIEGGIKNTLLENKLSLNLTAFYTTVTDAQVPTLVLPDAVTITKNTGKLTSKGVEAELNAALLKGLEVAYNVGYTKATYNDLKIAQNGAEVNLQGHRQIFTPDLTSMLAAQYSHGLFKKLDVKLVVRGEWKYLGTQYFDLANTLKQSPYNLYNTRFGFAAKNVTLMFWGRNLTGKKYIAYAYDFGAVHLGDPKTYGATLRYKF